MDRRLVILAFQSWAALVGIWLIWYAIATPSSFQSFPIHRLSSSSLLHTEEEKNNAPTYRICPKTEGDYLWSAMKQERDVLLRRAQEKGEDIVAGAKLYRLFPPVFTCPYTIKKMGPAGGGKYVCGAKELYGKDRGSHPSCIVYSFGIGRDVSFDTAIMNTTNCLVFGYDHTVNFKSRDPRMKFEKIGLAGYGAAHDKKTLKQLMDKNGHTCIDILKVDTEGAEFDGLNMVMDDFEELPFGQLQMEIHILPNFRKETFSKIIPWFNRLESKGLRAFHAESNDGSPSTVFEYSFINVNVRLFRNYTLSFFSSRWGYMGRPVKVRNITLDLDGLL